MLKWCFGGQPTSKNDVQPVVEKVEVKEKAIKAGNGDEEAASVGKLRDKSMLALSNPKKNADTAWLKVCM